MKYLVQLLLLVCAVIGTYAQESAPEKPVTLPSGSAVIADWKGEVTLNSAQGTSLAAQKGQVLAPDTSIETGKGSILLSLEDGSQVLIKSHSHVQLKAPEKSQGNFLQLFLGNIIAKVQKRLGMEPAFRMGTPTAVITVRGTRFSVEVTKKNKTIVEVYEGLVEVVGLAAPGRPVLVKPGFATQVQQQGTPDNPHSMQGSEGADEKFGPHGQNIGNEGDRNGSGSPSPAPAQRQGAAGESPD